MATEQALVEVEDLSRYYDGLCAVGNVSFALHKGDVLGFLGPNGAGKTTTMKMLAGNLAPSAGRITICGVDILDEPAAAKRKIGYLPERPPIYPELTVDEYLMYCGRLHDIPRKTIRGAVDSAKDRCGLTNTGGRLVGNLSKGYQQRVGIAQAIIHSPEVIILDEPTVGLDPIQIREIRDLIRTLGEDHSVIVSSHILPEIQSTCSKVQIIHRGRLVYADTMEALNRRTRSDRLVVGAHRLPDRETFDGMEGVTAVEPIDGERVRLHHAPGAELGERIARRAVESEWGLFELSPERKSLEQVFVELTATDQPKEESAA